MTSVENGVGVLNEGYIVDVGNTDIVVPRFDARKILKSPVVPLALGVGVGMALATRDTVAAQALMEVVQQDGGGFGGVTGIGFGTEVAVVGSLALLSSTVDLAYALKKREVEGVVDGVKSFVRGVASEFLQIAVPYGLLVAAESGVWEPRSGTLEPVALKVVEIAAWLKMGFGAIPDRAAGVKVWVADHCRDFSELILVELADFVPYIVHWLIMRS